jgi:hypothetical protein
MLSGMVPRLPWFERADPAFIEDPYPHLDTLRETAAVITTSDSTGTW